MLDMAEQPLTSIKVGRIKSGQRGDRLVIIYSRPGAAPISHEIPVKAFERWAMRKLREELFAPNTREAA